MSRKPFVPTKISVLNAKDIQYARDVVHETPENREKCLKRLKELIAEEENLYARSDDEYLCRFLRSNKYNCEAAFRMIKNYYSFRTQDPEILKDISVPPLKKIYDDKLITLLPYKDPDGRPICLFKLGFDTSRVSVKELFQALLIGDEKVATYESAQLHGASILLDFQGFGWAQMKELFQIRQVSQGAFITQHGIPMVMQKFHVMYQPFYLKTFYALLRPFMTEDYMRWTYFHGDDMSSLHKYLPPEILPEEYGGLLGPLDCMPWFNSLLDFEHTFLKDYEEYGYKLDKK